MEDVMEMVTETPKAFDSVNVAYGAVVGFLSLVFGEHWILFVGFLGLNVVDWLTGYYKSHILGIESSVEGAKGIAKKVWYWVVIAIAFFVANTFVEMGEVVGLKLDFVVLFGWFTLCTYIVNEIRSILENMVEIGVEVPEFLVKGLDVTKKLMEAKNGQDKDADSKSGELRQPAEHEAD